LFFNTFTEFSVQLVILAMLPKHSWQWSSCKYQAFHVGKTIDNGKHGHKILKLAGNVGTDDI
jgi:hypothetical protein